MNDKLYFGDILIAEIENTEEDAGNFTGQFKLVLKPEDELSTRLFNYVDFSQRQNDFYLSEEVGDEETEEKLLEEESTFDDFINSNSWHIIDHTGKKVKILIPTFDLQNTMVWRHNVGY